MEHKLINLVDEFKHKLTDNEYKTMCDTLNTYYKNNNVDVLEIEYVYPKIEHDDEDEDDECNNVFVIEMYKAREIICHKMVSAQTHVDVIKPLLSHYRICDLTVRSALLYSDIFITNIKKIGSAELYDFN